MHICLEMMQELDTGNLHLTEQSMRLTMRVVKQIDRDVLGVILLYTFLTSVLDVGE